VSEGLQRYLKKENVEMFLVVGLAMVLLVMLKVRFFGDASRGSSKAARPEPAMSEVQSEPTVSGSPAITAPRRQARSAGKTSVKPTDIPPFLSRDLFASLNPAYGVLELHKLKGAGGGRQGLVLQAIFVDSQRPLAIINDEVVGIGDPAGNAKVIAIGSDTVALSVGGREKILRMNEEGTP
jgi:hypothetical protein